MGLTIRTFNVANTIVDIKSTSMKAAIEADAAVVDDCVLLSNLCTTYAICNFCKAYKTSPYIRTIYEKVKYEDILDRSSESTIEKSHVFVSEKDIMEYFIKNMVQPYRKEIFRLSMPTFDYKKTLLYDGVQIGFLIGKYHDGFDIEYFVISPEWHGSNIGYQFMSVCINELVRTTGITKANINIHRPYTDQTKIKKFLNRFGFEESKRDYYTLNLGK